MTIRLILDIDPQQGGQVRVEGPELAYLLGVRRARPGDEVEIIARGAAHLARVQGVSARSACLLVERVGHRISPPLPVDVAVSVPKRQLMDDIVRGISELGVRSLLPLLLERTVMEPGAGKIERWRRVAEESMRQCGRTTALEVAEPMSLEEVCARVRSECVRKLMLHPGSPAGFPWRVSSSDGTCVLIGPEGGFVQAELEFARQEGFVPVGLGTTILRIETAAVTAAALCAAAVGSWLRDVDYN